MGFGGTAGLDLYVTGKGRLNGAVGFVAASLRSVGTLLEDGFGVAVMGNVIEFDVVDVTEGMGCGMGGKGRRWETVLESGGESTRFEREAREFLHPSGFGGGVGG